MQDRLTSLNPALDSYDLFNKLPKLSVGQAYDSRCFPKLIFRNEGDETDQQTASPFGASLSKASSESANLLSYLYLYFCQKHGASHPSSDVQEKLSEMSESIASAFLVVGALLKRVRIPHITVLNFDRCYFGGRQLMALADLLGVFSKIGGDIAASSGVSPYGRNFSLVPYLSTLSIRDARLNFYNNENERFDVPHFMTYDYSVVNGNDAFGYLFRALRGHPSLSTLDVSENPIGPYLLTSLVSLVKATPSLTTIHLGGTLLSTDEVQTVAAYCRVNELRQAKCFLMKDKDAPRSTEDRTDKSNYTWALALRKWALAHQNLDSDLEDALCPDGSVDLVMHGIVSEIRSPYIMLEYTMQKVLKAFPQLKSSDTKVSPSRFSNFQDTDSFSYSDRYSTIEQNNGNPSVLSSNESPSAGTLPFLQGSLSRVLYAPFFLYYLPNETPMLWSSESIDTLRSAFVDPVLAYNTFLGGRPVPRGVPLPIKSTSIQSGSKLLTLEEREYLTEAIGNSTLLRKVFLHLLPPPEKPIGHFATLAKDHKQYRTVAEENYYFICDKQREQRELLLNKLVDSLESVSYRVGDVLSEEDSELSCLFFIPPSTRGGHQPAMKKEEGETVVRVCLEYDLTEFNNAAPKNLDAVPVENAEVCQTQFLVYEEGDFFGELEVLAEVGSQSSKNAPTTSHKATHGAPSLPLSDPQAKRNRLVRATLQARDGEGTRGDPVCLWQLPKQVAFFFLHLPFQQIYQRTAAMFDSLPAFSQISPISILAFLYAVEPFVAELSRKEILEGSTARVIADNRMVGSNIYLLAKGEYNFSTYTALGSWIDKILFSGSAVVNGSVYHELKKDPEMSSLAVEAHASGTNVVLGKAIALRQFREAKRWKQQGGGKEAPARRMESTLNEEEPVDIEKTRKYEPKEKSKERAGLDASQTPPLPGDQRLSLDILDSGAEENIRCQWKYYVIPNAKFLSLPKEAKLAILSSCAIVTN